MAGMIPILYSANAELELLQDCNEINLHGADDGQLYAIGNNASRDFEHFGLGTLADTISCYVKEERNGGYELEMAYPINGIHYSDIELRCIVLAKPNFADDPQPFRIYKISKPIKGIVTIYAEHISYDLNGIVTSPFTAETCASAVAGLKSHSLTDNMFTIGTDISTSATFTVDVPSSVRSWFGGKTGSLIQLYKGEWHYDKFECRLLKSRGEDRGVTILYGKNLIDLTQEESCANVYTGCLAYWQDSEGEETVQGHIKHCEGDFGFERIKVIDCSQDYEETPTTEQLNEKALKYIEDNDIGTPSVNLKLSHIDLEGINRVDLCDTVSVYFEKLGVDATAKCISTTWDVLKGRYDEIEIGDAKSNFASAFKGVEETIVENTTYITKVVNTAKKLAEGINQHFLYNSEGAFVTSEETDGITSPKINFLRLTDDGLEIVDQSGLIASQFTQNGMQIFTGEESVAYFGKDEENDEKVAILGNYGKSAYAKMNQKRLTLTDEDGHTFFEAGDYSNSDKIASIEILAKGDGATKKFALPLSVKSITRVQVGQKITSDYSTEKDYTGEKISAIVFDEAPPSGSTIVFYVNYEGTHWFYSLGWRVGNIGKFSVVEGERNEAGGLCSHAEGQYTTASGNFAHAEGCKTTANGFASHAEGYMAKAVGRTSHAEGNTTTASGYEGSHAEGQYTTASGEGSHAEGESTIASGESSHAEGYETTASGEYSHAEGYGTTASGEGSHAEGYETTASKVYSHAEGNSTTASGKYSHAEGNATTASSESSHAEGNSTTASGKYSHAEGFNTIASYDYQHVGGKYNIESDGAEVIGGGSSDEQKNIRVLDWYGNEKLAGNLRVGGNLWFQNIIWCNDGRTVLRYRNDMVGIPLAYSNTTTSSANVCVSEAGYGYLTRSTSSSIRYKKNVRNIKDWESVYKIPVREFKYKKSYLGNNDIRANKFVSGFIAEEINEVYPMAVDLDEEGKPENWNVRFIIPPMLKAIQEQKKTIDKQQEKINQLEKRLSDIESFLNKEEE